MSNITDIVIKKVENRRDLKRFISFPYKLYAGNKYWVPPLRFDEMNTLRRDKNPAFEFCEVKYWLAYKDGKIAGRIAGIINWRYVERWQNKYARFGWIDFIDDEDVSKALIETVEKWAKEKGMRAVHGPLGFTDLDYEGMLIEGFEELGTMATIYNYPYYPKHLEKYGYTKDVDWVEFEIKAPQEVPEKINRVANIALERSNLRVLKVKKSKDLLPYAKDMFNVLDIAYRDIFGFVPLTDKQVDLYIKQYFGFIRPDYISIILDSSDRVAAFGITMPSLSKALQKAKGRLFPFGFLHLLKAMKNNSAIDLYLIGVRPDLQGKGVNSIIFNELHKIFIKNNVLTAETNVELETNYKVQAQWKHFTHRQHKRRRCYIKYLN
ncbi:MAG: GNAT family N-acetyltransferase [Candidatus Marinimicrobia bacterium]|nr:GNAT family N-acetyltransferase [Candidatus Neomarinimicrobiota bacterium]